MYSRPDLRPAEPASPWGGVSYRLALGLLVASTVLPLVLLVASESLDDDAAARLAAINRAGQLRYRTLEVFAAGRGELPLGRTAEVAFAELASVRGALAADFPTELRATDLAWQQLAAEAAAGPVSRATAERHLWDADRLVSTLVADAHGDVAAARLLFWLGVGSLFVTVAAAAGLAVRLRSLGTRVAEQAAHFRAFMDAGPAAVFVKDRDGGLFYTNRVCRQRFGLLAGHNQAETIDPAFVPTLLANDRATLAGDRVVTMEECVPEPDGRMTHWLSSKFPLAFADGRRLLGGLAIDITELKRAEAALRASEERLRLVVGALPTILHVIDRNGVVVMGEGRGLAALGRPPGYGVGQTWAEVTGNPVAVERFRHALAGQSFCAQVPVGDRWLDVCYSPQRDDHGQVTAVVVLLTDVTEQQEQLRLIRRQRDELEALARFDPLTGVFNRRALDERLAEEAARAARLDLPLGVVMVDLDHFKRLNDDLGHPAGDRTLKVVAGVLRGAVREIDTVARYGGEEFCVLLPGADAEAAGTVAERLRAAVAACDPPDRPVTASVGVAAGVPHGGPAELLAEADRALYRAKAGGRNRVAGPEAVAV